MQIGAVYTTFCQEEGLLCYCIAIEMGGASQYFSKVSGLGAGSTLLTFVWFAALISNHVEPNLGKERVVVLHRIAAVCKATATTDNW